LATQGRKGYIIAGGGSNALGGLGYVACAQELQQQFYEQDVRIDQVVVGSEALAEGNLDHEVPLERWRKRSAWR
jgi:1-aminocyclopropane-1-carboxylate deaminase/D-cysteine desulfhydrase-like pyridoxal-dependent ACC family enzyme